MAYQDGFLYVVGQTYGEAATRVQMGQGDGFVAKIDVAAEGDGRLVWLSTIGTHEGDDIRRVEIWDDSLHVVGHTWGAFSGYVNQGNTDVWYKELFSFELSSVSFGNTDRDLNS